jgi:hypothetical protein
LAAHELARSCMADRWNSTFIQFEKGDKVWLDSWNLKMIYHKKMKLKREGPFKITEVLGLVTYRLQLPSSWWIHNVFHATLLKPYKENKIYGPNFTSPPPELLDGEEVYDVETILNHQKRGWGYQYFIKWQGYLLRLQILVKNIASRIVAKGFAKSFVVRWALKECH